jgi:hypothetical protein
MQITHHKRTDDSPLKCLATWIQVTVELLPCPLCGVDGEQDLVDDKVICGAMELDEDEARGAWAIECGNCGIVLGPYRTSELAVKHWNNRTEAR